MSVVLPVLLVLSARADVSQSYHKLVSANGLGLVAFDRDAPSGAVLHLFSDHLYQQYSASQPETMDLLYDTYFGFRDAAGHGWMATADDAAYDPPGTGILAIPRTGPAGATVTERAFAPMGLDAPGFVHLAEVTASAGAATAITLFSLHNYHLGTDGGDGAWDDDERLWLEDGVLYEVGASTGLGMAIVPVTGPTSWTCDGTWWAVESGETLDGTCGTATDPTAGDDRVGGFQWQADLAAGETTTVGTIQVFFSGWDPTDAVAAARTWLGSRPADDLVQDERDAWSDWHALDNVPPGLTADERAVFDQSLAFLRMAQVREEGAAEGQIPASLSIGADAGGFGHIWNIAWVRDGAYAIRGLDAAGHPEEAEAALAFLLQDKAGTLLEEVGEDYAVSLCRCYGNGDEWSDEAWDAWGNPLGPNVEFDNWGLLLWALAEHVRAGGDLSFVESRREVVFDRLADILVRQVDPETGLIRADSSIWEVHWNGWQKRFTYTSAWAVRGLRGAADLAEALGDDTRADTYRDTAEGIQAAMCRSLVTEEGRLVGNLEEHLAGDGDLDLSAVDAFNAGAMDPLDVVGAPTFASWEALATDNGHGYMRNDDGGDYDRQDWAWVDLRLSTAARRACDPDRADALLGWVTDQAAANHHIVPEMYHPTDGVYEGPAPMLGYGAGLYALTLLERSEAEADCADGVTFSCEEQPADTAGPVDTSDTSSPSDTSNPGETGTGETGTPPPDSGDTSGDSGTGGTPKTCGCGATRTPSPGWVLALCAVLLPVTRRRRHGG